MTIGSFSLVLHGHLPYVLRHGVWPHGEDWLFEATAETYLPLLEVIDDCTLQGVLPRFTLGLTPVLLEQLNHEHFKTRFEKYLRERIERANADRREFESSGELHLAYLASRWTDFYHRRIEQFLGLERDIPAAFAERDRAGSIQILTSAATHAYLPLLLEDSCIRAQLRAGITTSERILGFRPQGIWLPECAYRGKGPWSSSNTNERKDQRLGIEELLVDEGITHFFVEHHLIEAGDAVAVQNDGRWWPVDSSEADKYPGRGWNSTQEAQGVFTGEIGSARLCAFGRNPNICELVWSGEVGYPGNGRYLEFHKKHGASRGLRYWKITGSGVELGQKDLYYPDDVPGAVYEHVQHFVDAVKREAREHQDQTGRTGMVTAAFDAELFGHWWFEGPQFLRDLILTLHADPEMEVTTPGRYLREQPPDKLVSLPEGSWGEGGDHRVWSSSQVTWIWEVEYRCETRFGQATYQLPWRQRAELRELLEKAGRELLLMQASDWIFIITRKQAVDYGFKRFMLHASRFETLVELAEKLASDSKYLGKLDEVERHDIKDADLHDVVFSAIDLNWWSMKAESQARQS